MDTTSVRYEQQKILNAMVARFSKRPYSTSSKDDENFMKDCLEKIASLEMGLIKLKHPSSNIKLNFYNDPQSSINGGFGSNIKTDGNNHFIKSSDIPFIEINMAQFIGKSIQSPSRFYLTDRDRDTRLSACLAAIDTVFHELEHYEQLLDMTSGTIYSYDILQMAKEEILMHMEYDDIYKANYSSINAEIDSRMTAHRKVSEIIQTFGDATVNSTSAKKKTDILSEAKRKYDINIDELMSDISGRRFGRSGNPQEKETFTRQQLDKWIKSDPGCLTIFPILRMEYNDDGTRKNAIELIKEYRNLQDDKTISQEGKKSKRRIYAELISDALELASEDEIEQLNELYNGTDNVSIKGLYKALREYNEKIFERKKESFEKYESITGENVSTTKTFLEQKYKRRLLMLQYYESGEITYPDKERIINGVDIDLVKNIEYTSDIQSKKDDRIRNLIEIYEKLENGNTFAMRKKREQAHINQIINAVELNRCRGSFLEALEIPEGQKGFSHEQIIIILTALKTADNLTIPGGRNYLQEFTNVPAMDHILRILIKDPQFLRMKEASEGNSKSKFRTELETDKIIAEQYLKSQENPQQYLAYYRDAKSIRADSPQHRIAIWRILARQQGYKINARNQEDAYYTRSDKTVGLIGRDEIKKYVSDPSRITVFLGRKFNTFCETIERSC